jgi:hypothetical protein
VYFQALSFPLVALIQRSAWKAYSPKFALSSSEWHHAPSTKRLG